jgi:hypothetical protein
MVAVVVAGCTTNTVQLDYTAGNIEAAKYTDVRPIDTVIVFDYRKNDPHWLGAIRGGFGNPLKKLTTKEAVSEVVQDAFESALQARGIPSEGADPFTMRINLVRFDSSQYVRREAHANVTVMLEGSDGDTEWTESFQSDVIQGSMFALDAGIFGSVEDLRKVALQALNEVIDQALNDPGFIDTLERTTSAAAGAASASSVAVSKPKQESKQNTTADGKAVAETLAALTLLHDQGVLSDKDYMQKQREIINEHTRKTQASLGGDVPPDSGAEANMSGVGSSTTIEPTSEKHFRVALFPMVSNTRSTFGGNDVVLTDYAHEYIRTHPDMALVFSAYDVRADWDAAGTVADVWTGGFTQKIPDESSVVSGTKRVGANVALLFAYKRRTSGWYGNDFVVEVYVMDIEKRKTYKLQGDELSYEKTIEAALNRLLSE